MMSLGSNLKTIRLFRNKTLKELGQILGFSTSSADVRISQYESDKKKPRENVIENLAYKLDVSPQAIDIPDIETYIGAIYTLFQLERSYGLKIDELDGQPILRFDKLLPHEQDTLYEYMQNWLEEAKNFREGKITQQQYEEWKYNFPKYSTLNINKQPREDWLHNQDDSISFLIINIICTTWCKSCRITFFTTYKIYK